MKAILVILAAVVGLFVVATPAQAHAVNEYDRVVINSATKYDRALHNAAYYWNRFYFRSDKQGPAFMYARDTTLSRTLRVSDYSNCKDRAAARYRHRPGFDLIMVNRCHLDRKDYKGRLTTFSHELGHALDMDHAPQTEYYRKTSIMYPTNHQPHAVPRAHDWQMYKRRWL